MRADRPLALVLAALLVLLGAASSEGCGPGGPGPADGGPDDGGEPDGGSAPGGGADGGSGDAGGADGGLTGIAYQEHRVPMRDNVQLRTGVYLPERLAAPLGVVLVRTRYWGFNPAQQRVHDQLAALFVERGYGLVVQSTRGVYGSQGTFVQYRGEEEDGRDTTDWIVTQPWSNGRIATWGGSYLAYTALAAAADNPNVKVVIADDAPIDVNHDRRFSGIPSLLTLSWLNRLGKTSDQVDSAPLFVAQQLLEVQRADRVVLGAPSAEWQDWVAHPAPEDPYWVAQSLRSVVNRVCVPVLSIKSNAQWSDPDLIFRALQSNPCPDHADVRLLVTQESHTFHTSAAGLPITRGSSENQLILDYIDKFLGQRPVDLSTVPAVQYRAATEPRVYRSSAGWPPAAQARSYYLSGGGRFFAGGLQATAPGAEAPTLLRVEPEAGACAQFPYAVWVSSPLGAPLYVAGFPTLELFASATTVDADFTVTLHELPPNLAAGQLFSPSSPALVSTRVAHGGLRARYRAGLDREVPLVPGARERLVLRMDALAHEFQAGHRIAITVGASRCHAVDVLLQFENPHTGEPLGAQTRWLSSDYHVFHEVQAPTRLILPAVR